MTTGNAFSLAQWFDIPKECNAADEDFLREEVLTEAHNFVAYGVSGDLVLLKTPRGRVLCSAKTVSGCPIVEFDWVESGRWSRRTFWMNQSSVADLSAKLKASPDKRRPFDELFINP